MAEETNDQKADNQQPNNLTAEGAAAAAAEPFCHLQLGPKETITVYGALKTYIRVLSEQSVDQLDAIKTAVEVMSALRPAAQVVAKSFAQQNQTSI
jgi:hypothetical protein